MNYLTREQMEALTTRRLLAYRNSLHRSWEDYKETEGWKQHHAECVEILSKREHVEKKQMNSRKVK